MVCALWGGAPGDWATELSRSWVQPGVDNLPSGGRIGSSIRQRQQQLSFSTDVVGVSSFCCLRHLLFGIVVMHMCLIACLF